MVGSHEVAGDYMLKNFKQSNDINSGYFELYITQNVFKSLANFTNKIVAIPYA